MADNIMKRKIKKLTGLSLKEISGVDHPASLHEGWAVMKSSDNELDVVLADVMETDNKELSMESEILKEETIDSSVEEEVVDVEVSKEYVTLKKELDDAQAQISQLKEDAEMAKAVTDCKKWNIIPQLDPSTFAPVLCSLRSLDANVSEQIEEILDATAIALGEVGILKEVGSEGSPSAEDAYGQIESIAKAMVQEGTVKSLAEGISKVAVDQPDLYSAYVAEQRGA